MKYFLVILLLTISVPQLLSQDDLLSLVEEEEIVIYTSAAFKTTRVMNGHSIENVHNGVLDFKISHRFGFLNSGAGQLFGLDNSTVRLGLDYGISDRLMIGIGRSSLEKTVDGFFKYKLLRQADSGKETPISLSYVAAIEIVTTEFANPDRDNFSSSRYSFVHQIIWAKKFNDRFSLQFMPTLVHRNLVETSEFSNDVFSLGFAFREKLSNRLTVNAEYYFLLPDQLEDQFRNSLAIGLDIETGGHVFQIHFTNSTSMVYKGFVAETRGDFFNGDIHFGFNISRVFTLKKPKYE